jgi:adenylylsulfate kinase-like enzyme
MRTNVRRGLKCFTEAGGVENVRRVGEVRKVDGQGGIDRSKFISFRAERRRLIDWQ